MMIAASLILDKNPLHVKLPTGKLSAKSEIDAQYGTFAPLFEAFKGSEHPKPRAEEEVEEDLFEDDREEARNALEPDPEQFRQVESRNRYGRLIRERLANPCVIRILATYPIIPSIDITIRFSSNFTIEWHFHVACQSAKFSEALSPSRKTWPNFRKRLV
jgi:hypothetical protein